MNVFKWSNMSATRRRYFVRLIGRCAVLCVCFVMCFIAPEQFSVLEKQSFFAKPSLLHLLWVIWVIDMVMQLIPLRSHVPLGSQKHFLIRFRPIKERVSKDAIKNYIVSTTRSAFWVLILWTALILVIGVLYWLGVFNNVTLFMFTVLFYVCDLICVLIWCPFRLIMKNKCCTTCRIFNWDHLMMFTPMLFIGSFYAVSLLLFAIAVWVLWEACVALFPERFWEETNGALRCSECTDKLCTQYCRKLR